MISPIHALRSTDDDAFNEAAKRKLVLMRVKTAWAWTSRDTVALMLLKADMAASNVRNYDVREKPEPQSW